MRDANMKGGSLESGTSHKQKITGLPDQATIMKPTQKPPMESNKSAGGGHSIRTNTKGY